MSTPTAERQIEFILSHILEWKMEPRPPGASFFDMKVCVLRVTPYQEQPQNRATREILLAVLNKCIAIEDAKRAEERGHKPWINLLRKMKPEQRKGT